MNATDSATAAKLAKHLFDAHALWLSLSPAAVATILAEVKETHCALPHMSEVDALAHVVLEASR